MDVFFPTKAFAGYEIDNFTDIEITFFVYDSSDLNYKPIVYETINIYPYGEDKAVKYVREPQADDNVIIDNEYATVIVTGYNPDGKNGYTVNLFLINKTDDTLMYSVEELSINGYEIAFFMQILYMVETVILVSCLLFQNCWKKTLLKLKLLKSGLEYLISITKMISIIQMISSF